MFYGLCSDEHGWQCPACWQDKTRDRAFGFQSDLNPKDINSEAFKYKPQGQKYVNEGLPSYVGEVCTMLIGQLDPDQVDWTGSTKMGSMQY